MCTQIFILVFASHHMLGEVIPITPKLFTLIRLNVRQFFEILLPHIYSGRPNFLDLTFKAAPISEHVAKFRGVQSRQLGCIARKCKNKTIDPNFFVEALPHFETYVV